ncbi:Uncharacterised protein [Mycobacterium tuberculosis]|nr:Uncharacterised protein [Mycobacterium tuberculosis]
MAGRQQAAGQPDDPLGERGIARKVLGFQIFRGDALGFRIRMVDGPTGEPVVHLEPAPCPAEPNGTTQRFAVGGVGAQLRMSERENARPRLRSAQQADHPGGVGHAQLVSLQRIGNPRFGHLIAEPDVGPCGS